MVKAITVSFGETENKRAPMTEQLNPQFLEQVIHTLPPAAPGVGGTGEFDGIRLQTEC